MRGETSLAVPLGTLCALAALASGCATRLAPREWLPYAQQAQQQAWGGWIQLELRPVTDRAGVGGELLALSADSVHVLQGDTVRAYPTAAIARATVEFYDPRSAEAGQLTFAGTLLTITHGWGLILSAPLWIIVGSASTGALSNDGQIRYQAPDRARGKVVPWQQLAIHARFPQGMPPGLDRTRLHARPSRVKSERKQWPGTITR